VTSLTYDVTDAWGHGHASPNTSIAMLQAWKRPSEAVCMHMWIEECIANQVAVGHTSVHVLWSDDQIQHLLHAVYALR
jgi:hypothetical protein